VSTRTYIVTTISMTQCLVMARDEDSALRDWIADPDSEEARSVRRATRGEIRRIATHTPEYDYR
jgi:hypothetical protein